MKPDTSYIACRRCDSNGKAVFQIRLFLNNESLEGLRLDANLEATVLPNACVYFINKTELGINVNGKRLKSGIIWDSRRKYKREVPDVWKDVGIDWMYFPVEIEKFSNGITGCRIRKGEEIK